MHFCLKQNDVNNILLRARTHCSLSRWIRCISRTGTARNCIHTIDFVLEKIFMNRFLLLNSFFKPTLKEHLVHAFHADTTHSIPKFLGAMIRKVVALWTISRLFTLQNIFDVNKFLLQCLQLIAAFAFECPFYYPSRHRDRWCNRNLRLNQNLQKENLNDTHYNLESKHYFSVRIECVRTLAVLCRNIDEMTNWRIHSIHQYTPSNKKTNKQASERTNGRTKKHAHKRTNMLTRPTSHAHLNANVNAKRKRHATQNANSQPGTWLTPPTSDFWYTTKTMMTIMTTMQNILTNSLHVHATWPRKNCKG